MPDVPVLEIESREGDNDILCATEDVFVIDAGPCLGVGAGTRGWLYMPGIWQCCDAISAALRGRLWLRAWQGTSLQSVLERFKDRFSSRKDKFCSLNFSTIFSSWSWGIVELMLRVSLEAAPRAAGAAQVPKALSSCLAMVLLLERESLEGE
jgi:hypothetical protein